MEIKRFGILLNNLDASPKSIHIINGINNLVSQQYMYAPTIFFINRAAPPIVPMCSQIQQNHSWGYEGVLIATDISSALNLNECIRAKRKLFYIFDLEWMSLPMIIYRDMCQIYKNPKIDLIVQNPEHYEIISNCWKKPLGIVKDFNYDEIINYIN